MLSCNCTISLSRRADKLMYKVIAIWGNSVVIVV